MFQINDFKAFSDSINLDGASSIAGERLRLTSDKPNQSGACGIQQRKLISPMDLKRNLLSLISSDSKDKMAGDGFAFVIQAQSPKHNRRHRR
jgi:hypothetical protein